MSTEKKEKQKNKKILTPTHKAGISQNWHLNQKNYTPTHNTNTAIAITRVSSSLSSSFVEVINHHQTIGSSITVASSVASISSDIWLINYLICKLRSESHRCLTSLIDSEKFNKLIVTRFFIYLQ